MVTAQLICAFVFATTIEQLHYFLILKFQASSHLLWPYSQICVEPGRKLRIQVFSRRGTHILCIKCIHSFTLYTTFHRAKISVLTAVSGVGSSPALATCETSQVLLAGVSGGFPGVLPFRPPIDWLVSMSEIILKGTLN